MARRNAPTIVFDGSLYWYAGCFDQDEDRCSSCRELISEDDVPLILFKDVAGQTWMARLHFDTCGARLIRQGKLKMRPAVEASVKH